MMNSNLKEVPCDGCAWTSCAGTLNRCKVTHHDNTADVVLYCDECVELARCDWNGETQALEIL